MHVVGDAGAVNVMVEPVPLMPPHVADQPTDVSAGPVTVAVNCVVSSGSRSTWVGSMEMSATMTETAAVSTTVGSKSLRTVTCVVPAPTPVTVPSSSTSATVSSSLLHVTAKSGVPTTPVSVAVNCAVSPTRTSIASGSMSVPPIASPASTATVAVAVAEAEATLVAVMAHVPSNEGATYVTVDPEPLNAPHVALHVTSVSVVPLTTAVNRVDASGFSVTVAGLMEMPTSATVMVAVAVASGSTTLVAVSSWLPEVYGAV